MLAWDRPTRIFKWALVFLVADAWASNTYGASHPGWHKWNGYALLVAIVFRVLWGFCGGSTARFSHFVKPWGVFAYLPTLLRVAGTRYLGHNPMGGIWIVAVLFALGLQGALGLYASDEDRVVIEGPLARTVSDATVNAASHWHVVGYNVILGLIGLHLLAVLLYEVVRRQRLIRAMITGTKPRADYLDESEARPGSAQAALACLGTAIVTVFGAITLLGGNVLQ